MEEILSIGTFTFWGEPSITAPVINPVIVQLVKNKNDRLANRKNNDKRLILIDLRV